MNIDLIVFPLIIILSLSLGQKNTPKNRRTFIILVSILLLLKASLRSLSVGSDTHVYYEDYQIIMQTPWREVFLSFLDRYKTLSGDYDMGYNILQKVISLFTSDFHVFTFIAQLLFYVPFGILVYRFSSDFLQITLAYVLYTSLFMGLPMANARQFYSIGLGIMAYLCVYDKKYVKAAIWIMLGFFIHQTCLLVILPIALQFVPIKTIKRSSLVAFFFFPIVMFFANEVIYFMGDFVENERYMRYGQQGYDQNVAVTYLISTFLMCAFCYFTIKEKQLLSHTQTCFLYVMLPLTVLFSPLIYSNGSMIRIVMYYQLYFTILFPYAIDCAFKHDRRIAYIGSIALLIFMSLRSAGHNYYFFWQKPDLLF